MRNFLIATATLGLVLAVAPTGLGDAHGETVVSGSYLIGNPVAWAYLDACGAGATDGVDSSCAAVPPGSIGYSLSINDALGSIVVASVCFYAAGDFLDCDPVTVPAGADQFSVSSIGGAAVTWSVTFT